MQISKKTALLIFAFLFLFAAAVPLQGFAQTTTDDAVSTTGDDALKSAGAPLEQAQAPTIQEEAIEARVIEVVETRYSTDTNSNNAIQQKLKLKGLTGGWKGKIFEYNGISEIQVFGSNKYNKGDRVLVQHSVDPDGNDVFYVVDFIRRPYLYALAIIFALIIIITAKQKGLRALLSLAFSFLVIMLAMIPLILNGWSPLIVGVMGSVIIFIFMVYVTEGFNKKSHLAIITIAISLLIVGLLSILFTWLTRLTGTAQEETMFLIGLTKQAINFKGLLLAGVLIGTLGVLDDIVIGQIEAVIQIKKANPFLPVKKVFQMSLEVGNSHMGSMVNTLFLAYAGASLPLLLLFSIKQPPFMTFSQAINNEIIATEVLRTLIGSIGIALAMPIATYLAAKYYHVAKPERSRHAPQDACA